ncbi:MAG: hypothetical protein V2I67_21050 [Thermoanaerobaculales bacterium]|jgi:hypothetical protein|nr:hypothetical protein [Thermoanaerobaculales bacterium]
MTTHLAPRSLARWDGLHLVLDLVLVEEHLMRLLAEVEQLDGLALAAAGDALDVSATVKWKGVRSRVALELAELRLRHRHLGFRMRKLRVYGGVPVPRAAVEAILDGIDNELITVFRGQGIVVVDLRRWLPPELDLKIVTVQATESSLHLWFGAGGLTDLPGFGRKRLASGEKPPAALDSGKENTPRTA